MSKCFITKYLGTLNTSDEEAVYYDSIVLKIPVVTDGSYERTAFGTEGKEPNIKWLSGGNINIIKEEGFKKSVTFADNETEPAYVKVSPIYDLSEITTYHGDIVNPSQIRRLHKIKILTIPKAKGVDLSFLSDLTSLTRFSLGTSVTGDIANLKGLTSLTTLDLNGTSVTGDIANLKGLTSLTSIILTNPSVTGDIANLKGLTSLTTLALNNTSVTGDIANLNDIVKQLPKRHLPLGNTNVTGDLSACYNAYCIAGSNKTFTWASDNARSSKTDVPLLSVSWARIKLGTDLDKFLIDNAKCTNVSANPNAKILLVSGTRTSDSDEALTTLQNNGITVTINN